MQSETPGTITPPLTWPRDLGALGRRVLSTLFDWRLLVLVGTYLVLTLLSTQVPFSYTFIAGNERGIQSDLPFLQNFNATEASDEMGRWRWSRAEAAIVVPAIGQRDVVVGMNIVSHRGQWFTDEPPPTLTLHMNQARSVDIELRRQGARYHVLIPASTMDDGSLRLGLETTGWQHPDDRRGNLGVAIGERVTIASTQQAGLVLPSGGLLLFWSLGLGLGWLSLRVLDFRPTLALWLLLPLALALPLVLTYAAPRIGFGNVWAVQAGLITLATAVLCLWLVPPFLQRFGVLPTPALLRWLLLLVVLSFTLKYGARLYPESMPGDLQLHVNRYLATVTGNIYIPAQHRGLPFPFPNALYVLVAPFTLTGFGGIHPHFWFAFLDGVLEASTVLLLYMILARATGSRQLGLLAAASYALTPGGHMVAWFAFATQVHAQWAAVVLVAVLVYSWPQRRDWLTWAVAVMLLVQVFLGHIGQFMNLGLLGLLLVPLLWWRARTAEERAGTWWVLGAGLAAGLFVGLFYYSAFSTMISEQVTGAATQGLNELTGRAPIPRAESLRALWEGGFIEHFGFFALLLALPGALLLATPRWRGSILPPLVWLSFAVSVSQAVLPFITLNSITTRWLMFSAWAIALTSALAFLRLWRCGRAARVVGLAMTGYVIWNTVVVWTNAMTLRLPPIEPF